jgi:prepilin signal peptidase PulO-like enzyme (type II secretory pathway)
LGAIFGNIGTTLFFRIPRNIPINGIEKPPMCSFCGIKLKYPYYAPFFQFILKGLKCYSCGAKIPLIYTLIEFFAGMFCALFFTFNPLNGYFIIKFLSILLIFLSTLIFFKESKFYDKLNWILLSTSLLKLGYNSNGLDLLQILITEKLITGLLFGLVFFIICKRKIIQEICFFIVLAVFFDRMEFLTASIISLLILLILKDKKGIFLIPFLIISLT